MVSSLVGAVGGTDPDGTPRTIQAPMSYERQLSCQIWSIDGRMVARSSGAPERRLSDAPAGFSEREVDGETWRGFTVEGLTAEPSGNVSIPSTDGVIQGYASAWRGPWFGMASTIWVGATL